MYINNEDNELFFYLFDVPSNRTSTVNPNVLVAKKKAMYNASCKMIIS